MSGELLLKVFSRSGDPCQIRDGGFEDPGTASANCLGGNLPNPFRDKQYPFRRQWRLSRLKSYQNRGRQRAKAGELMSRHIPRLQGHFEVRGLPGVVCVTLDLPLFIWFLNRQVDLGA